LELSNPKKKIYIVKEYYENGNVKEEGEMIYNISLGDYQKNGKWKFYDEQGNLKEEKIFSKGEESEE
jgi:antitoxin component YwqK of YwqJK toxin-antitoxin module